jgi:hypothetical protein
MTSAEVLDEGSNEWQTGPRLPFGILYAEMVENKNERVVLIGGSSAAYP